MRIRSFVALPLSVALTRRLVEEVATRRAALGSLAQQIAWVPAANLHVTVKFLGSIEEEAVGAIRDRLRRCISELQPAPLELRVSGFGAFPDVTKPNVLWAQVALTPALETLVATVERDLVAFGLTAEERSYHPHVTVGRVRNGDASGTPATPLTIEQWASFFGDVNLGSCAAQELVLYESRTPRAGVEYIRLGHASLTSSGVPSGSPPSSSFTKPRREAKEAATTPTKET